MMSIEVSGSKPMPGTIKTHRQGQVLPIAGVDLPLEPDDRRVLVLVAHDELVVLRLVLDHLAELVAVSVLQFITLV